MTHFFLSRPGILSALGTGPEETFHRMLLGDTSGMLLEDGWLHNRPARVGRVKSPLADVPSALSRHNSRNNRLLITAFEQIKEEFDACIGRHGPARVGIVLGTSTSGISDGESAVAEFEQSGRIPATFAYEQMDIGDPAVFLAQYLGVEGPAYTVSTACSSGSKAMMSARNLIRAGVCDAVVTGAVDTLSRLTVGGFSALESTSVELCQPLSRNRQGINIGEGAALFILSSKESPVALLGAGESSDAHHISAPEPNGRGAEAAMLAALNDANLGPGNIGYVNLHATATPKNDAMESLAVARVFTHDVPVSGTKPMTGHALGAAGAIEAALTWLSLADPAGQLPPHVWDGAIDPDLPALHVVMPGECFTQTSRYAISNSFAFGGNNVAIVLGAMK